MPFSKSSLIVVIFSHQVKSWAALQIKQFTALQFQHKSKGTFNENNVYAKSKLGITLLYRVL